jgi:hypothetical protein
MKKSQVSQIELLHGLGISVGDTKQKSKLDLVKNSTFGNMICKQSSI